MTTFANINSKLNLVNAQNERMAGSVPVYGENSFAKELAEIEPESGDATNQEDKKPSFGFSDLFDIINPLQHIPIISAIYRQITGDEISTVAEVTGGGLYGGPVGATIAAATSAIKIAIKSSKDVDSDTDIKTAKIIQPVINKYSDTTIALANLRGDYTSYNV